MVLDFRCYEMVVWGKNGEELAHTSVDGAISRAFDEGRTRSSITANLRL
jgi:hypothetical protein